MIKVKAFICLFFELTLLRPESFCELKYSKTREKAKYIRNIDFIITRFASLLLLPPIKSQAMNLESALKHL
jgi:hypothetical protein